ncbi:hypothetical protein ASPSYDRAFT_30082 [Aspergillus sydowii CBS 593.65]|uniref:Uncharacterized protein n=1 Tax=Aspergillus sydowii CBS 593.65 TaxID=1036612 RepID=A0A1L9TQA1_9EURO|nr:uncharacterized protein ASPSYDRAFT_30082 [Aspergillus sydowii CBS 593.65]OJJ61602.1 hypothetical protein ASPSYDRAFT_30082 [Aspergillus sydowii CBS 593.65]
MTKTRHPPGLSLAVLGNEPKRCWRPMAVTLRHVLITLPILWFEVAQGGPTVLSIVFPSFVASWIAPDGSKRRLGFPFDKCSTFPMHDPGFQIQERKRLTLLANEKIDDNRNPGCLSHGVTSLAVDKLLVTSPVS